MRWRSSSSPWLVILGKVRSIALVDMGLFLGSKHLAVDLAGRRLGQLGDELDQAGVFVMAEAPAHEVLDLAAERLVARPVGDDERLHPPAPQRTRHAAGACLAGSRGR